MFEQEAYGVSPFHPMPQFCQYGSNDLLHHSPHLGYRRHSSYSHEDILNMKHQHISIDPRYRDTRAFSNSNIYDHARRDFMSRRRSSSSLQEEFQRMQMNEFMRKSSPTMNRTRSSSPNVSEKSNSNWNLAPSIFIEEYNDDPQPEVKSNNNSSTNVSITEQFQQQPLNEETVAQFAGCDVIPFIDDENVCVTAQHNHHTCDNYLPDVHCVDCSNASNDPSNEISIQIPVPIQPAITSKSTTEQPPLIKSARKTVSFDLMDTIDDAIIITKDQIQEQMQQRQQEQQQKSMLNKHLNKCDHITNVMLNKCDKDAIGTKMNCASDVTSTITTNIELNEPIFKFCTFKRTNSNNTKPNDETESFKNTPSLDNDNFSAYFYDDETTNGQTLYTNNKTINDNTSTSIATSTFDTKAITLDLSELHSDSTNSNSTQHDCESLFDTNEITISTTTTKQHPIFQMFVHEPPPDVMPVSVAPSSWNRQHLIEHGKVRALKDYFEKLKLLKKAKSSPNLSKGNQQKMSRLEQTAVLKQLKMWSEFGTTDEEKINDRSNNNNSRNINANNDKENSVKKKSNVIANPITRSVLNLTVTTSFDDHTSRIQLTESERSFSEPNIDECYQQLSDFNDVTIDESSMQRKPGVDGRTVHKQKISANIETTEKFMQSCPNLCHKSASTQNPVYISKVKANIYNSPCHRSTYLTLRKIKQNQKINKLSKNSNSNAPQNGSCQSFKISSNYDDAANETR